MIIMAVLTAVNARFLDQVDEPVSPTRLITLAEAAKLALDARNYILA